MGSSVKLHSIALCALAMIALVTFALLWWGLSLVAALITAILVGCPLAVLYTWIQARRTLRRLNETTRPSA